MHSRSAAEPRKASGSESADRTAEEPGPDLGSAGPSARRLRPSAVSAVPSGQGGAASGPGVTQTPAGQSTALADQVLSGPGAPLGADIRRLMEERLGADFGHVRVHTGERAAASSGALGAEAYTVGGSVVFAAGRYAPYREEGRDLLAHELMHTLQQDAGGPSAGGRALGVEPPGSAAETEAQAMARASRGGWSPGTARQAARMPARIAPSRVAPRGVIQCQRVPKVTSELEKYLGIKDTTGENAVRRDEVADAYRRLVAHELARIGGNIEQLPSATVKQLNLVPLLEALKTLWAQEASWTPEKRATQLPHLVEMVNKLATESGTVLAEFQKQEAGPQAELLSPSGNKNIETAIELLEVKVIASMNKSNSAVPGSIAMLFRTSAPKATGRIQEIVKLLRGLYHRPDNNPGFVLGSELPSSMLAEASGKGAYRRVKLSRDALRADVPLARLAAVLMHEGSHLIEDPTVDFAYRGSGEHYFLAPELALYNAANYEQVAADAVGDHYYDALPDSEIDRGRSADASQAQLAASLVTAQITRAWVLAGHLRAKFRSGRQVSNLPHSVVTILNLPQSPGTESLTSALLDGLLSAVELLNHTAQAGIVIRSGGFRKGRIYEKGGRSVVEMPGDARELRPPEMARSVLHRLCERMIEIRATPLTASQLLAFILNAKTLEEQRLQGMVSTYLSTYAADKPSVSEELDDFYRSRSPHEF